MLALRHFNQRNISVNKRLKNLSHRVVSAVHIVSNATGVSLRSEVVKTTYSATEFSALSIEGIPVRLPRNDTSRVFLLPTRQSHFDQALMSILLNRTNAWSSFAVCRTILQLPSVSIVVE